MSSNSCLDEEEEEEELFQPNQPLLVPLDRDITMVIYRGRSIAREIFLITGLVSRTT